MIAVLYICHELCWDRALHVVGCIVYNPCPYSHPPWDYPSQETSLGGADHLPRRCCILNEDRSYNPSRLVTLKTCAAPTPSYQRVILHLGCCQLILQVIQYWYCTVQYMCTYGTVQRMQACKILTKPFRQQSFGSHSCDGTDGLPLCEGGGSLNSPNISFRTAR